MKLLDRPFVAVRWADAHGAATTEYAEHELPHRPAHYTTYGFLMRQDDAGLTIVTEHSDEHTYRGVSFVPAAMVVEIIALKLGQARTKKVPVPTTSEEST
jgi:hypothetical protein